MAFMEEECASEKRRAVAKDKAVSARQVDPPSAIPCSSGKGSEPKPSETVAPGCRAAEQTYGDAAQAHGMLGTVLAAPGISISGTSAGAPNCGAYAPFLPQTLSGGSAMLSAPFFVVQQPLHATVFAPQATMAPYMQAHTMHSMQTHSMQTGQRPSEPPPGQRRTYLDEAAVVQIFLAKHSNPGVRDLNLSGRLAREYGVTSKAVRDIWNMRTWKSVTEPYRNQYSAVVEQEEEPEHDSPQEGAEEDD